MNKKEFLDFIKPNVEAYFLPLGFVYKKSKGAFVKQIEDGWVSVSFSFYDFALTCNVNLGFEVRINSVEELFVKYIQINPSDHKTIPTIIFSLTGLLNHEFNSFRFTTDSELNQILQEKITPFLTNKLPVFTERYSKLENIYKLLTSSNEENHSKIQSNYDNYITTLIIGYLIFSDAEFEKVITWCNTQFLTMKNRNPNSLDIERYDSDFNNIVADLRSLKHFLTK